MDSDNREKEKGSINYGLKKQRTEEGKKFTDGTVFYN